MASVLRCIRPSAAEFDRRSDSLIASEDSFSRHSSIQGPYREGMTDTSFPVYCTTKSQSRGPGIYARSTLSLGHGLGVYNIVGNVARPKYHIAQGAFVGDVGYSNDGGTFLHCFNIFYPSDHPIQPESLPPQFTPINLPAGGIRTIPDHFTPGTVLCSEGIKYTQTSESPLQIEFSTKAREGSVLVLPNGASREELVDKSLMHAYVKEYAASWYRFYNGDNDGTAETPISNGILRIVTSVDRADAWAIATFPSEDLLLRRRDRKNETHFKYNKEDKFPWDGDSTIRPLDYSFGYASEDEVGAVLLGLSSVALSPAQWSRNVAYIPPRCVRSCPVLSVPPIGLQARIRRIIEYIKGTTKPPSVDDPIGDFHPSIIILHILLLSDPSAIVGMIDDSVWVPQLNKWLLTHPEVVGLIQRVFDACDVMNTDGLVTLVPKQPQDSSPAPPSLGRNQGLFASYRVLSRISRQREEESKSIVQQQMAKVLWLPE